jgi:hypothetical protein
LEEIASILFKRASSKVHENPWRHFCSSVETLYIRKRSNVFDIYESELRKVIHQVHRIFIADETGIKRVKQRHSKVVRMRGKK